MTDTNIPQKSKTFGSQQLKTVILKLIDSSTLRAKNHRVSIALPNGLMIKLSPFDLAWISSILSAAKFSNDFQNIPLSYIDDINLKLQKTTVSVATLKSVVDYLTNLSLRIDLKSSYRLYQLKSCSTTDELLNLLNNINHEEDNIELDYLKQF